MSAGRTVVLAIGLTLAACTTISGDALTQKGAPQDRTETITIGVGPCFGFCPVYDASISPNGTVRFEGRRHTAVLGERTRAAGPATYRDLARDLAIYRPATGTETVVECTAVVSDTSPYIVTWTDATGSKTTATVQGGCPDGAGHELFGILRAVPSRLGILEWSRQTTRPGASRG